MKSGSLSLTEPSRPVQGLLHLFFLHYVHTATYVHTHTHAHTHTHTFSAHRITDSAAIIRGVCVHVIYMFIYPLYGFIQPSVTHAGHHYKNLWTTHVYGLQIEHFVTVRVSELQTAG